MLIITTGETESYSANTIPEILPQWLHTNMFNNWYYTKTYKDLPVFVVCRLYF